MIRVRPYTEGNSRWCNACAVLTSPDPARVMPDGSNLYTMFRVRGGADGVEDIDLYFCFECLNDLEYACNAALTERSLAKDTVEVR